MLGRGDATDDEGLGSGDSGGLLGGGDASGDAGGGGLGSGDSGGLLDGGDAGSDTGGGGCLAVVTRAVIQVVAGCLATRPETVGARGA